MTEEATSYDPKPRWCSFAPDYVALAVPFRTTLPEKTKRTLMTPTNEAIPFQGGTLEVGTLLYHIDTTRNGTPHLLVLSVRKLKRSKRSPSSALICRVGMPTDLNVRWTRRAEDGLLKQTLVFVRDLDRQYFLTPAPAIEQALCGARKEQKAATRTLKEAQRALDKMEAFAAKGKGKHARFVPRLVRMPKATKA